MQGCFDVRALKRNLRMRVFMDGDEVGVLSQIRCDDVDNTTFRIPWNVWPFLSLGRFHFVGHLAVCFWERQYSAFRHMYMANETTILLSEYTQETSIMEKIVYSIIWVLLLLFVAWPLACFCAAWWIFFLPLEAFLPVLRDANNFLEKYDVLCALVRFYRNVLSLSHTHTHCCFLFPSFIDSYCGLVRLVRLSRMGPKIFLHPFEYVWCLTMQSWLVHVI